jgi:hypothetical protein
MSRRRSKFLIGFAFGVTLSAVINLIPYVVTHRLYVTDGDEIIGFPFIFRRYGGFSPVYEFRVDLLIADAAIALPFALMCGFAYQMISKRTKRTPHGFSLAPFEEK